MGVVGVDAGTESGWVAPTCGPESDGVRIMSVGHTDVWTTGGEGKKMRVFAPFEAKRDLHVGGKLRVGGREVATQAHLADLGETLARCENLDERAAAMVARVERAEARLAKYTAWAKGPTFVPADASELRAALEACALGSMGRGTPEEVAEAWAAWTGDGCTANATAFPVLQAPISLWNTSRVTDMAGLFEGAAAFNGDVQGWDTRAVTTMKAMFSGAAAFDQNVGRWDVSSVEDLSEMFRGAAAFDNGGSPRIGRWDTRAVANMSEAFALTKAFAQDLSQWSLCDGCNGGASTDTTGMLRGAAAYHARYSCASPLLGARTCVRRAAFRPADKTALATALQSCQGAAQGDLEWTWADCVGGDDNQGIAFWDTSMVTDMAGLLSGMTTFDADIGRWDVGQVTDMSSLFDHAYVFNADISEWNISALTRMNRMFQYAYAFDQDLSDWDTSSVRDMSYAFYYSTSFAGDLSDWDLSSVSSTRGMFRRAYAFKGDISGWDVGGVTDMAVMFQKASSFNADLSRWDTSRVTSMSYMFSFAESFISDLSDWDTSSVTDMAGMFAGALAMRGSPYVCPESPASLAECSWPVHPADKAELEAALAACAGGYGAGDQAWQAWTGECVSGPPITEWDVSLVADMSGLFAYASAFSADLSDWDTSSVTAMTTMFLFAEVFAADLSRWDTSRATGSGALSYMFTGSSVMTAAPYDCPESPDFGPTLSQCKWPVHAADKDELVGALASCAGGYGAGDQAWQAWTGECATAFPIQTWDVSLVTDMSGLFAYAYNFKADLSEWDTSSATDLSNMFYGALAMTGAPYACPESPESPASSLWECTW